MTPVASFSQSPDPASEYEPVEISALTTDTGEATGFTWHFAGEQPLREAGSVIRREFPEGGEYLVALVAQNRFGCRDTVLGKIRVEQDYAFYVPNAFTPDGDGRNDGFGPVTRGVEDYWLQVFDRWGGLVYAGTRQSPPWDGTRRGQSCPQGTYAWKAEITKQTGERVSRTGFVLLVR